MACEMLIPAFVGAAAAPREPSGAPGAVHHINYGHADPNDTSQETLELGGLAKAACRCFRVW